MDEGPEEYLKSRGWQTRSIKSSAYVGHENRWQHPSCGGPWLSISKATWLQKKINLYLKWRQNRILK